MAHIVSAVQECFEGEALCARMERWVETNAESIDANCRADISDGIGLPHHYTQLHAEWCRLVESALESAVEDAGGTIQEFYDAIEMGQRARPDNIDDDSCGRGEGGCGSGDDTAGWAHDASFVSLINATVSFDFWLDVMIDTASSLAQDCKE